MFAVNGYRRASRRIFTIARLGGDEFTVLLDHIKEPSDAKSAADR